MDKKKWNNWWETIYNKTLEKIKQEENTNVIYIYVFLINNIIF